MKHFSDNFCDNDRSYLEQEIEDLERVVSDLRDENKILLDENEQFQKEINDLLSERKHLYDEIDYYYDGD